MSTPKKPGPKGSELAPPPSKSAVSPEVMEQCFVFEAWEMHGIDILELDTFIRSGPLLDADRASAIQDRERASSLYAAGGFDHAMEVIRLLLMMRQIVEKLVPAAKTGKKFIAGRKPGAAGPIRKAIAKLLKKNPGFKNPDLWAALSANPPRGWNFFDNREGRYIEGPRIAEDHMVYGRFCTVCGEERKKLKP